MIGGEVFAIIGTLSVQQQVRYECLHVYRPIHIALCPRFLKTYADILREFLRRDTRFYTGLVAKMPVDDLYVMAERAAGWFAATGAA